MNLEFKQAIITILEDVMSERGFKLWTILNDRLPDIWNRPSSSTGKYHLKDGNRQPNLDEHVYDMIYVASKLYKMFKIEKKSNECDILFLAIVLHDSLKYGLDGTRHHTDKTHDRLAANMIRENEQTFLKLLTNGQVNILEDAIRFHSGPWSTDASKDFNFNDRHSYAFFVHILDMLSTNDLIKLPQENKI